MYEINWDLILRGHFKMRFIKGERHRDCMGLDILLRGNMTSFGDFYRFKGSFSRCIGV